MQTFARLDTCFTWLALRPAFGVVRFIRRLKPLKMQQLAFEWVWFTKHCSRYMMDNYIRKQEPTHWILVYKCVPYYSFRIPKSDFSARCESWSSLMSSNSSTSTVGSQVLVTYSDVSSNREARTISRLKLALVAVSFGLLVMTVLFVWQITKRNDSSEQVS